MAVSLLETFQTYLTADVLQEISAFVGEEPARIELAVQAAVPALLAGLTERMSTTLGSARVMSLINQVGTRLDVAALLGVNGSGGGAGAKAGASPINPPFADLATLGSGLLAAIFGSTLSPIVETLATVSGLGSESALSLLSLLTSIVLGVLGREVATQHLGPASLAARLESEREEISAFVPPQLGAAMSGAATEVGSPAAPSSGRRGFAWFVPAAVVALLVLGGWYFLRPDSLEERRAAAFSPPASGDTPAATSTPTPTPTPTPPSTPAPAPPPTSPPPVAASAPTPAAAPPAAPADADEESVTPGKITSVKLPGGRSLKLEEGSASYTLDRFLARGGDQGNGDLPKSFAFERLSFENNSTELMKRSRHMVTELIEILKAYPSVEVRIEGHTDDHGNKERNKTLSLARAKALKAALVAGGIAESRLTAEGIGPDRPIASNGTAAGRRHNRRIEVVVEKR